jgi:hypothetical protein
LHRPAAPGDPLDRSGDGQGDGSLAALGAAHLAGAPPATASCNRILQPHRRRTFKRSRDPAFATKLADIVGLYVDPPAHAVVLSLDEKSQILGLLDGAVIGRCMQRHRHSEFIRFLNAAERAVPADKPTHAVLDNYATRKHPKSLPPRRRGCWPGSIATSAGPSTSRPPPPRGSMPSRTSFPRLPASARARLAMVVEMTQPAMSIGWSTMFVTNKAVMAGLVPAIYALPTPALPTSVDARLNAGHDIDGQGSKPLEPIRSDELIVKVVPGRIYRQDEVHLPASRPMLHVSLVLDRRAGIAVALHVYQPLQPISLGEPGQNAFAMLPSVFREVARHPGMLDAVRAVRHYVGPGTCHTATLQPRGIGRNALVDGRDKPGHDGKRAVFCDSRARCRGSALLCSARS